MEKTIAATDIVRNFSEILNAVKYKHDHYTILRGGKPVASILPVEKYSETKTLKDLKNILKTLPALNDEGKNFERDLKDIRKNQPPIPMEKQWA